MSVLYNAKKVKVVKYSQVWLVLSVFINFCKRFTLDFFFLLAFLAESCFRKYINKCHSNMYFNGRIQKKPNEIHSDLLKKHVSQKITQAKYYTYTASLFVKLRMQWMRLLDCIFWSDIFFLISSYFGMMQLLLSMDWIC